MTKRGAHRSHVSGDHLRDSQRGLWLTTLGDRTDEAEVDGLLSAHVPVVLHGFGRPLRALSPGDARRWWKDARPHVEVPGSDRGTRPEDDGLTYAAQVWARDGRRLLGFVENC